MPKKTRNAADDLRGATRLVIEATTHVTGAVEAMHQTIGAGPVLLGQPLAEVVKALTAPVYGTVRGVTKLVGAAIDRALGALGPWLAESAPRPEHEAVLAAVNGVVGDYLARTGNPLAIEMHFRAGGRPLAPDRESLRAAFPGAGSRLFVLVHGSSMSDLQWTRGDHDHGAALTRDLGVPAIYLHYNSGLHVSTNGTAFSALLERLVHEWPSPLHELIIIGHSMGGLVARSACHVAELEGCAWRKALVALVFLGTPHHGAALERGGHWVHRLLGASRYSAPIGRLARLRSAGVTDLRFGNVLDEHWSGVDRFEEGSDRRRKLSLPAGVACFAIAGSLSAGPEPAPRGDGLVSVDSALGRSAAAALTLGFPGANQRIVYGTGHVDLLGSQEVYATLRGWMQTLLPAPAG